MKECHFILKLKSKQPNFKNLKCIYVDIFPLGQLLINIGRSVKNQVFAKSRFQSWDVQLVCVLKFEPEWPISPQNKQETVENTLLRILSRLNITYTSVGSCLFHFLVIFTLTQKMYSTLR